MSGYGLHAVPKDQRYPPGLQMGMDKGCHLIIERCHDLALHLDDGCRDTSFYQVFRHLYADEPAAYHHGALWLFRVHKAPDPVGIRYGAQAEDLVAVNAFEARPYGFRTRRQDDLVIAQGIGITGRVLPDMNDLVFPVNGSYLAHHPYVDAVPVSENLGCGHEQIISPLDDMPDVVGKSAVGKGDELAPFEKHDLSILINPAGPGGCSCSACNSANDYKPCAHKRPPGQMLFEFSLIITPKDSRSM